MSILVTGGTGNTGSHLVRLLKAGEHDFRVLVRNEEKAEILEEQGVRTVPGDLAERASLENILEDVDKVFLLSSPSTEQVGLQGNMIAASKAAGVKYIVKVSAIGTSPDSSVALCRWHAQTEEQIRESGLPYTFLHPHSFMQNNLMSVPTIKEQGTIFSPLADGKVAAIDIRDVAAVAAVCLTEPGHEGKTYTLTGPTAISMKEMADIFSTVLGKEVKYVPVSFEDGRRAALQAGIAEWLADDLTELNKIFAAGYGAEVTPDVQNVTGKPATTFEQFVRDHAALFK